MAPRARALIKRARRGGGRTRRRACPVLRAVLGRAEQTVHTIQWTQGTPPSLKTRSSPGSEPDPRQGRIPGPPYTARSHPHTPAGPRTHGRAIPYSPTLEPYLDRIPARGPWPKSWGGHTWDELRPGEPGRARVSLRRSLAPPTPRSGGVRRQCTTRLFPVCQGKVSRKTAPPAGQPAGARPGAAGAPRLPAGRGT